MMRLRNQRGYTAVEVLAAMMVFSIGAAGVIGMQKVSIAGNEDARRFDVANNIANEWTSRLQRDAMSWTKPNELDRTTENWAATKFLTDIGAAGCTGVNWCLAGMSGGFPSGAAVPGNSPAFDLFGRDLPKAGGGVEHFYCTQYRLNWIADPGSCPGTSSGEPCITALMRAEIRVFWNRLEAGPITDCEGVAAPDPVKHHIFYTTTAIRENALK